MYRASFFLTAALIGTTIALVQPMAMAKSESEIETITRAVTVEIRLKSDSRAIGSGVIIHRKGDLYTLVTNRHVICGSSSCNNILATEIYSLNMPDGHQYRAQKPVIKLLADNNNKDLDLAIIQFRSDRNYAIAKLSSPGSLKAEDIVYTSGFPDKLGFVTQFFLGQGNTIAMVDKRLNGDTGGYTILYDAPTLPGMSGGGIFNNNGQLVAIHGYGDRFKQNTDITRKSKINSKIGINRGIPISWLRKSLSETEINLQTNRANTSIRSTNQQVTTSADEYFIIGFNNFVDPGKNVIAGKRQAIQTFSKAIQINPKYAIAYYMRAILHRQIQDLQQSLSDCNQAIRLNPKDSDFYYNRASLKQDELNDALGALADYNQAILINPEHSYAYNNRAILKKNSLNDAPGALADFNQAISINPTHPDAYYNRANLKYQRLRDLPGAMKDYNQAISINPQDSEAYYSRGMMKRDALNDRVGAIQDLRQAARLSREQGNTPKSQLAIEQLQQLGASE
jgi:tetratricopeptide (TPR) repeat protein